MRATSRFANSPSRLLSSLAITALLISSRLNAADLPPSEGLKPAEVILTHD